MEWTIVLLAVGVLSSGISGLVLGKRVSTLESRVAELEHKTAQIIPVIGGK